MKTLVTGASGFVGGQLARALVEQGREVKVLLRKTSDTRMLEGLKIEKCFGDVTDFESLLNAIKDCEAVYHVAALYAFWAPDLNDFYRINVEGTRNVMKACAEQGVKKVVYTSTVGAVGVEPDGRLATEETTWNFGAYGDHYITSKRMAEMEADIWAAKGLPVVIVNPSAPIGIGDWKPTPTGGLIVDLLNKRLPGYTDTEMNFVDVEDVVKGHILAEEKGVPGERYLLTHWNAPVKDFMDLVEKLSGVKAPKIKFPSWSMKVMGHAVGFAMGTVLNRTPLVTASQGRMAEVKMRYDNKKAREKLGLTFTPIEETVQKTIDWYRQNEYVK